MDTPTDDLMVIQQKYGDFSISGHGSSVTHLPLPCR
jgi:hypothetical protein